MTDCQTEANAQIVVTENNLQILRARGGKEINGVRSLNLIQYFTGKNDGNNNNKRQRLSSDV
jgi:hypothetical protein